MVAVVLANGEGKVGMAAAIEAVRAGRSALDAVEAGIRVVEADPNVRSVGFGGAPNILGQMECDAAIMCGATLRTGAVGALKDYVHAISVARKVMDLTPHVMLVGDGASRFAAEAGEVKAELLSEDARADYEEWMSAHLPETLMSRWPDVPLAPLVVQPVRRRHRYAEGDTEGAQPAGSNRPHGTTVFLVRTRDGTMAGGTSTSGWAYKYPGRLSDSCMIGAGLYVDQRYGGAACTHTGEMIIRAGVTRAVVTYMKRGATAEEACREAFNDLRSLKGGTIGPVIIHTVDATSEPFVLTTGNDGGIPYWFWRDDMLREEWRKPMLEKL
ncbi:MAG TPA: N(4)-(beta-N-acetylglucosaminyl)-L-asparaginase [bacterium]|nr:N(4)-(beta-N-acetylglucosaminyl)-L-asparaginase [bacterium]